MSSACKNKKGPSSDAVAFFERDNIMLDRICHAELVPVSYFLLPPKSKTLKRVQGDDTKICHHALMLLRRVFWLAITNVILNSFQDLTFSLLQRSKMLERSHRR